MLLHAGCSADFVSPILAFRCGSRFAAPGCDAIEADRNHSDENTDEEDSHRIDASWPRDMRKSCRKKRVDTTRITR